MDSASLHDHPGICDVHRIAGGRAGTAAPTLLLEVPHGATRAADFAALRADLRGDYAADLQDFFFVNTDVGAPEVALQVARTIVADAPDRAVLVVVSRLPRTFVDCNRELDAAPPPSSNPNQLTPGLPGYVRHVGDRTLLLARHRTYRKVAAAAYAAVCGAGGLALMVHSYAPRSVDVPVDDRIVEHLRNAYRPEVVGTWALRPPVDLIARDPDGALLASPRLVAEVERAFVAAGHQPAHQEAYSLMPGTLANVFASQYPGRTLCLELRRDLLVREFTPFAEMLPDPQRVAAMAAPLADAVRAAWRAEATSPR